MQDSIDLLIKNTENEKKMFFFNIDNNFLCSHIAQLVEAGRGHLNIKQFNRKRLKKKEKERKDRR